MQTLPLYIRATIKLLLAILIVFVLIVLKDLLIPLTVAVFFSFLLLPISRKLEAWKFPRSLAILISILLAFIVVGGFCYFFFAQMSNFATELPALKQMILSKGERVLQWIQNKTGMQQEALMDYLKERASESAGSSSDVVFSVFSFTGSLITNLALIPIYIFFITLFREKYKIFLAAIIKEDQREEMVLDIVKKISGVSQKYIKGIIIDVAILSVLNSTGFYLLGLEHAILFGVLASVLNIIPYIGVLVGSILPVIMALVTRDEMAYAAGALGVCIIVQFIDNNFITPYVVGSSVSINPLTATIVLIASGMMWGIAGMVLCLPLTGMLKVVFDNIDSLKPYGYLLGEEIDYSQKETFQDKMIKSFKSSMKTKKK